MTKEEKKETGKLVRFDQLFRSKELQMKGVWVEIEWLKDCDPVLFEIQAESREVKLKFTEKRDRLTKNARKDNAKLSEAVENEIFARAMAGTVVTNISGIQGAPDQITEEHLEEILSSGDALKNRLLIKRSENATWLEEFAESREGKFVIGA